MKTTQHGHPAHVQDAPREAGQAGARATVEQTQHSQHHTGTATHHRAVRTARHHKEE